MLKVLSTIDLLSFRYNSLCCHTCSLITQRSCNWFS